VIVGSAVNTPPAATKRLQLKPKSAPTPFAAMTAQRPRDSVVRPTRSPPDGIPAGATPASPTSAVVHTEAVTVSEKNSAAPIVPATLVPAASPTEIPAVVAMAPKPETRSSTRPTRAAQAHRAITDQTAPRAHYPRSYHKATLSDELLFQNQDTTLLGDSIMLAASRAIAERFRVVNINAVVGRQADALALVIARLHAANALTPIVIFDVGNNGTIDVATLEGMLQNLSSCQRVVVVNAHVPRPWENEANDVIDSIVPKYANTVIADWHGAANGHDAEYFGDDRVHPNSVGARAYTDTIVDALERSASPAAAALAQVRRR
jgi:hypothetical protein